MSMIYDTISDGPRARFNDVVSGVYGYILNKVNSALTCLVTAERTTY